MNITDSTEIRKLATNEKGALDWARPTRSKCYDLTVALADAVDSGDETEIDAAYAAWNHRRHKLAAEVAAAEAAKMIDAIHYWESDDEADAVDRPESTVENASKGAEIDWDRRVVRGWSVTHGFGDDYDVVETDPVSF